MNSSLNYSTNGSDPKRKIERRGWKCIAEWELQITCNSLAFCSLSYQQYWHRSPSWNFFIQSSCLNHKHHYHRTKSDNKRENWPCGICSIPMTRLYSHCPVGDINWPCTKVVLEFDEWSTLQSKSHTSTLQWKDNICWWRQVCKQLEVEEVIKKKSFKHSVEKRENRYYQWLNMHFLKLSSFYSQIHYTIMLLTVCFFAWIESVALPF